MCKHIILNFIYRCKLTNIILWYGKLRLKFTGKIHAYTCACVNVCVCFTVDTPLAT